jgi:hypothetical protein
VINYLQTDWHDDRTTLVFVIVSTFLLVTPVLRYVYAGWKYKADDITNSIDDGAKRLYLEKFQKQITRDNQDARTAFYKNYHARFGRRYFIIPIVVLLLVAVLGSSLAVESIIKPGHHHLWSPELRLNETGLAALAGAFMWVVSDFIWRARRMDFSPSDVLWGTLRLFIAAPLGLSLGSIIKPEVLAFVAFGLGAFPLETIQSFLRQLSAKSLNIELGTVQDSKLLRLDGVDPILVERFTHEDITSIVQLAYCDPIQLTMRSNLSFNAVVDLVNQALAWVYIEDKLLRIRPLGLRGAYELRAFCEELGSSTSEPTRTNAQNIITEVAERLGVSQEKMWFVITTIAYDPYTDFIYQTWN